jgi:hypothetical protein
VKLVPIAVGSELAQSIPQRFQSLHIIVHFNLSAVGSTTVLFGLVGLPDILPDT